MDIVCQLCGAVGHGNITCPLCRQKNPVMPHDIRERLRGIQVGFPAGTSKASPFVPMIKAVNRHNRRMKARGMKRV